MIFTDMTVFEDGKQVGYIAPAKFIYSKPMGTATTEVAIRTTAGEDVYAIMNTVNPETKLGTFRVIIRPFVAWIWIGGMLMIFGTAFCMAPSVREVLNALSSARAPRRPVMAMATGVLLLLATAAVLGVAWPAQALGQSDSSSSLHAGSVTMHDPKERQLFERLLCECGDCERLPLSTCTCSWAERERARIRKAVAAGVTPLAIQDEYRELYGSQAIAIPSDKGLDRALWAVPVVLIVLAAGGVVMLGRRFARRGRQPAGAAGASGSGDGEAPGLGRTELDAALERELERLDDGGK
jgi:cytochrome c-type biogenesis protein CcmH/NrfF